MPLIPRCARDLRRRSLFALAASVTACSSDQTERTSVDANTQQEPMASDAATKADSSIGAWDAAVLRDTGSSEARAPKDAAADGAALRDAHSIDPIDASDASEAGALDASESSFADADAAPTDTDAASHCRDGLLNGDETDVDCGGKACDPCPPGSSCSDLMDCSTMMCAGGVCQELDCSGQIMNGPHTTFSDAFQTWGAAVADYDRDGRDDVLLTYHYAPNARTYLYRNHGNGSFEASLMLPFRDRHGCAAGDVNGDGRVDFICLIGGAAGTLPGLPELWLQDPSGALPTNHGCEWGLVSGGRGRRPILFDADGDGDLDLYITNWSETADQAIWSHNRLYIQETGHFVERQSGATGTFGSHDVDVGDWDGDGLPDLVVSGEQLHLFRNIGGDFEETTSSLGAPVDWPRDADLKDIDGDGFADLVVATTTRIEVRLNQHSEPRFGVVHYSTEISDGWRVLVADVTGDGLLDFYVQQHGSNCDTPPGTNTDDLLFSGPPFGQLSLGLQPTTGCGDDVYLLDGRVLVLNGEDAASGPVQLLDLRGP